MAYAPRERLGQIPPKDLRRMYQPHRVPVSQLKREEASGGRSGAPVVNIFMLGTGSGQIAPRELLGMIFRGMR